MTEGFRKLGDLVNELIQKLPPPAEQEGWSRADIPWMPEFWFNQMIQHFGESMLLIACTRTERPDGIVMRGQAFVHPDSMEEFKSWLDARKVEH